MAEKKGKAEPEEHVRALARIWRKKGKKEAPQAKEA